ncbi:MAG: cyclopropane-fatty-acyl-phospholipid synthase family protein, partial [Gammaproteobacteria bacterium]|nr:cyclopropane-fatty-acyl-phospholipid synthase family protein [Gammaproteobacteria bacterium]
LDFIENGVTFSMIGKNPDWVHAELTVHDAQFYRYLAFGGSVGAAEAYMLGFWSSPNLTNVIRLFAINQDAMDDMESGLARATAPLKKAFHWLNKNTTEGSRKNIAAHYDLGNELFTRFLDPTMMYSSGIYKNAESTLEEASIEKIDRICRRLQLTPNDRVVEIGTGWGGFAVHAAKNYGCHVTTTTISEEQHSYAKELIAREGLEDKVDLLFEDYRKLEGQFDKMVSIEMIEAVGHHFYNEYFKTCSHLLKPNGEFLLQAITIADQRFDSAKSEIDFIKRYIFPGSCIPSINAISQSVTQATDMRIVNLYDMGQHYAKTLMHWHENFNNTFDELRDHGYDDTFRRMWNFYLCYCAGGFMEGVISVAQIHLVKPLARTPHYVDEINDY